MKVAVDQMASSGLLVEVPRAGGDPDRVLLKHGEGVRGTYSQDGAGISLDAVVAEVLDLERILLHAGESPLAVRILGMESAAVDLRVVRGESASGTIRARGVVARSIDVRLDGAGSIAVDELAARDVAIEIAAGGFQLVVGALELSGCALQLPSFELAWQRGRVKDLRLARVDGRLEVSVAEIDLDGVVLAMPALELSVSCLHLPEGGRWERDALRVSRALAADARLVLPDLARREVRAPTSPRPVPTSWEVLDGLEGRIEVDLTVDARIPILGNRAGNYRFRIPVEDGMVDYHAIERSLSLLVDAVLDFVVRGDKLIFEKNVPLVPWDNKTLVWWPLDPEERALAERHLVRLKTLMHAQLSADMAPRSEDGARAKGGFQLRRVGLDPISIVLRVGAPAALPLGGGSLELGSATHDAVRELRIEGALHHPPDPEPALGHLRLAAKGLGGVLRDVSPGGHATTSGSFTGDVDSVDIAFRGFAPVHLEANVGNLTLRSVVVACYSSSSSTSLPLTANQ